MTSFPKVVLASASPRRQELLKAAGFRFEVFPANVVEYEESSCDPCLLVKHNARLKAEDVAKKRPADLVLAADTTVAFENTVLNKPKDRDEAVHMLRMLSGKEHRVLTGVCLISLERKICKEWVSESSVRLLPLSDSQIKHYHEKVFPLDKAGAYAIQEYPEMIIESFKGLRSNVMGLPIEELLQVLSKPLME